MPISEKEIEIDCLYVTETKQLRIVTDIQSDDDNRERVHYLAKSARIKGRKFAAHTISNPPLKKTFARACDRRLSEKEIQLLVEEGILVKDHDDDWQ